MDALNRPTLALALLCAGCTGDHALLVELYTDYEPAVQFDAVRVEVAGEMMERAIARSDEVRRGLRVASLSLPAGNHRVAVTLLAGGAVVDGTEIAVRLQSDRVVPAIVDRACANLTCAEACLNGECVPYECTPETPEACPADVLCEAATDCEAATESCLTAECVAGACLDLPVTGACGDEEWCDPDVGCRSVAPAPADGGVDAGSGCSRSTADCNGDAADGCEVDLESDRLHCGACEVVCASHQACVSGACEVLVDVTSLAAFGGPSSRVLPFALDAHASGPIVVVGRLEGIADFGGPPLDADGTAGFVVGYDAAGAWTDQLVTPSTGFTTVNGVTLKVPGEVWWTGEARGTTSPPGGPSFSTSNIDAWWAHYDAARGGHVGSGRDGRAGVDFGHDVDAIQGSDDAIVVGYVQGDAVVATSPYEFQGALAGGRDAFAARVRGDGSVVWVRFLGGPGADEARGVAVSGDRVFVVGSFEDGASFGGPTRSATGADLFIAVLGLDGAYVTDVTGGGPGDDQALGVAVHEASGDAIVVGETSGGQLGGRSLAGGGSDGDAFVARVDRDGAVLWTQARGGAGEDVLHGVAVRAGAVFVTGYFRGDLPLVDGAPFFTPAGSRESFVAELGVSTGGLRWALELGGSEVVALGIGVDDAGQIAVAGSFEGSMRVGLESRDAVGPTDGFLLRLQRR